MRGHCSNKSRDTRFLKLWRASKNDGTVRCPRNITFELPSLAAQMDRALDDIITEREDRPVRISSKIPWTKPLTASLQQRGPPRRQDNRRPPPRQPRRDREEYPRDGVKKVHRRIYSLHHAPISDKHTRCISPPYQSGLPATQSSTSFRLLRRRRRRPGRDRTGITDIAEQPYQSAPVNFES